MKKHTALFEILFSIFLITTIFYNMGCSGTTTNSSFNPPSNLPPTAGTLPGTSTGVTAPTEFFVGIVADPSSVANVRASTDFSTACSISPSAAQTDIDCIIDIPEGDLYTNGITLSYNVPPVMCKYLRQTPYWFYNKEVGIGAKNITLNNTFNASGDLTGTACVFDGVAAPTCADDEVSIDSSGGSTCVYDNSSSGGANCCFGAKNITTNKITPSGTTTTFLGSSWGGDLIDCIGGPGKTNWPSNLLSPNDVPLSQVRLALSGLKDTFKVNAPLGTVSTSSNTGISNYYHSTNHTHVGFVDPRSTNLPYFIDPVDDRSGTPIPSPTLDANNFLVPAEDAYRFECLDEAHEVKHRIKVYIREWNSYLDFTQYIAGAGTPAVFDRGGAEGAPTCAGITGPCNDIGDNDDFLSALPGGIYDVTTPANRGSFFPGL